MFEIIEIFRAWCRQKIVLHTVNRGPKLFKEGEVWWCQIGMNVGDEIYGKGKKFTRPVLVFKKFSHATFLAIPLTSREKNGSWYVEAGCGGTRRWAILNQARMLDASRLKSRIGTMDRVAHTRVRAAFLKLYSS